LVIVVGLVIFLVILLYQHILKCLMYFSNLMSLVIHLLSLQFYNILQMNLLKPL